MEMKFSTRWAVSFNLCAALAAGIYAADRVTDISITTANMFPESITSLRDGTLIIGSSGLGSIWKIAPGKTVASEFIKPGTAGLSTVLGVLADEKSNMLWVCSNNLDGKGGSPTSAKGFDLKTGALRASFNLPGANALCNDFAVNSDGTVYIADTRQNSVLMLRKGSVALEVAAKDDTLLAGADGLAFTDKKLYVNSVSQNRLVRLDLGKDGKSTKITDLTLSQKVDRPDGMRSIKGGRLLLAENAGKMDVITLNGQMATIQTIKDGLDGTPAVTETRGLAWIIEGKLNLKGKGDGTPYRLAAVPLPK